MPISLITRRALVRAVSPTVLYAAFQWKVVPGSNSGVKYNDQDSRATRPTLIETTYAE